MTSMRGREGDAAAAKAYQAALEAKGLACDHPPRLRRSVLALDRVPWDQRRLDPCEWECMACGALQVYRGADRAPGAGGGVL